MILLKAMAETFACDGEHNQKPEFHGDSIYKVDRSLQLSFNRFFQVVWCLFLVINGVETRPFGVRFLMLPAMVTTMSYIRQEASEIHQT